MSSRKGKEVSKKRKDAPGSGKKQTVLVFKRPRDVEPSKGVDDLLVHPRNHFKSRVSLCHMPDLADFLKSHLSDRALDKFKQTIFGWVLGLRNMNVQAQLVHALCLRESACNDVESMMFKVGGKYLRFGLEDFCIMTGLKVHGNLKYPRFEPDHFRLNERYFPGKSEVDRNLVKELLVNRSVVDEDDIVKFAILLIVFWFFNSSTKKSL